MEATEEHYLCLKVALRGAKWWTLDTNAPKSSECSSLFAFNVHLASVLQGLRKIGLARRGVRDETVKRQNRFEIVKAESEMAKAI